VVAAFHRLRKWRSHAARDFQRMTSSASVEDGIARVVSDLLHQVPCPPTDLDKVCQKLDVSIRDSDELIGTGALIRDGASFNILCASGLPLERRRFTIAHEIAHLVIDRSAKRIVRHSSELERLCDVFAAELLMPRPVFVAALARSARLRDLPALAKSFQVSLTSAAIRWAELKRVSIFEVREDRVTWGVGLIRRGRITELDETLMPAIARAIAGEAGADEVHLNVQESIRRCEVEYWPLGKSKRAFILVRILPTAPSHSQMGALGTDIT